ncbi:MAG: DUF433 domain-containing protein [Bacteroidia bacterium]
MKHPLITRNPEVLLGKPIIKGTRISVELIMRKLAGGFTIQDLLDQYPHLNQIQVQAAFMYAADKIADEIELETAA